MPDAPQVWTEHEVEDIRSTWGTAALLRRLAPTEYRDPELKRAFAEYERQSASPAIAGATLRMLFEGDLRHVLPAVRVPTLVIAHTDSARIPTAASKYMADHIEGARYVELAGNENLIWAGNQSAMLGQLQEFITGVRASPEMERVLSTVLFTDIVDSTHRAAELGDFAWRELLDRHYEIARAQLAALRGVEVRQPATACSRTFDGPAHASPRAQAIVAAEREVDPSFERGYTPAKSNGRVRTYVAWPYTLVPALLPWPVREKCLCRPQ